MSHSGERFSKCLHCGETIYQWQTMGVWNHFYADRPTCRAGVGRAEPRPTEQEGSSA